MPFALKLVVLLFFVLGLMAIYTVAATSRVESAYPPTGDFITVQGVRLHYVTAREMYNIAAAAMDGAEGDPNDYRDYLIAPPAVAG